MENLPVVAEPKEPDVSSYFSSMERFEMGQRMCKMLASSSLVPTTYQGNVANTLIALSWPTAPPAAPSLSCRIYM